LGPLTACSSFFSSSPRFFSSSPRFFSSSPRFFSSSPRFSPPLLAFSPPLLAFSPLILHQILFICTSVRTVSLNTCGGSLDSLFNGMIIKSDLLDIQHQLFFFFDTAPIALSFSPPLLAFSPLSLLILYQILFICKSVRTVSLNACGGSLDSLLNGMIINSDLQEIQRVGLRILHTKKK
jgi:hypothetical protein